MTQTTEQLLTDKRKRARRTAIVLALVALAFYGGFIAIGVLGK